MSGKKSAKSKLVKQEMSDDSSAKCFQNETYDEDDISRLISQYRAGAKKKTETSSGSNPEYTKKVLEAMNLQYEARTQANEHFFKVISEIVTQSEADHNTMLESEQKLKHLIGTFLKFIQQTNTAYGEKLNALKDVRDSFKKRCEEMESEQRTEIKKVVEEIVYDINKLQDKLVAETKRSGWETLRRSIFLAMQNENMNI